MRIFYKQLTLTSIQTVNQLKIEHCEKIVLTTVALDLDKDIACLQQYALNIFHKHLTLISMYYQLKTKCALRCEYCVTVLCVINILQLT